MAPLEPWEKAIVDAEKFLATDHGKIACIECHSGVSTAIEKAAAHEGLIAEPSGQPAQFCGECHEEQTASYDNALHNTQAGYWTAIDARAGDVPENHPALEEMFGNHCATCHTTCGECHVAQPENVGGGLFSGHVFEKTPPMTRSCTACHGSRVGNEYLGKNEGIPGDVHFREGRMNCVKCHEGADLHGTADATAAADHRLSGAEDPKCEDCHPTVVPGGDENPMHQAHGEKLSCQVCHSVIVDLLPPPLALILAAPPMPADHAGHVTDSCTACHATGIREAPIFPENHVDFKNENCTGCHKSQ